MSNTRNQFTGNLDRAGNTTIFFIAGKLKKLFYKKLLSKTPLAKSVLALLTGSQDQQQTQEFTKKICLETTALTISNEKMSYIMKQLHLLNNLVY